MNEELQGLKNFCANIKPAMLKVKEGKKLTAVEQQKIVQFYLEVVHVISTIE
jgi:hypothetical protein